VYCSGQGTFASADDFAHTLASNSGTTLDMIGSGAVSRKDNAGE